MSKISEISVPTLYNKFPKAKRPYPISERDNLMRALRHEKPLWMPNFEGGTQDIPPAEVTIKREEGEKFKNAWGVEYQYSEAQGSATPITTVLSDVTSWKEDLVWPKLEDIKFSTEGFVRDDNLALSGHLISVGFEHLHMLEGFEQALIDLITNPDDCRELFEATVDYTIELFHKQNKEYHFDYIMYHDDWGTARAPFFSVDLMKETLLAPAKRLAKAIQDEGVQFVFHNCGLVNDFIPYIVEDIGADALQIQWINDLGHIIKTYGDRVTVENRRPETFLMFDPETTLDQVRDAARRAVDQYGAHTNPGAGAIVTINAPTEDVFNAFDGTMFEYSLEKYKGL
jgi:hypothetical protein